MTKFKFQVKCFNLDQINDQNSDLKPIYTRVTIENPDEFHVVNDSWVIRKNTEKNSLLYDCICFDKFGRRVYYE